MNITERDNAMLLSLGIEGMRAGDEVVEVAFATLRLGPPSPAAASRRIAVSIHEAMERMVRAAELNRDEYVNEEEDEEEDDDL